MTKLIALAAMVVALLAAAPAAHAAYWGSIAPDGWTWTGE